MKRFLSFISLNNFSENFRIFFKKALLCFPVLLIITGLNYFIDPSHLFSPGEYEAGIANYLLEGYNVAGITEYDERILQYYYINGLTEKKDFIAIGSSRSMEINSVLFHGKSFFNNSVPNATTEDYMAIYGLYRDKNLCPSVIILGMEPWILNKNNNETGWKSIKKYYYEIEKITLPSSYRTQIFDFIPEKYLELISIGYFKASLSLFIKQLKSKNNNLHYYPTKEVTSGERIKLSDGSLLYEKGYRERGIEEVKKAAISYGENPPGFNHFYNLDNNKIYQLEAFINLLLKDNVKIIFFLPPYHPETYKRLINSEKYKIIIEAEAYFKKLALKNKIKIIGSFAPETCNLTEKDFYDGVHPKRSAIENLFKVP